MKMRALLLLLVLPYSVFAQDLNTRIQQADSVIQDYFDEKNLPGMSISVYLDNGMVFSKGYGYADINALVPVKPSITKFRIGSVSKTLTAAGLGVLLQDDVLRANDEIREWVLDFPKKEYPITVKQVAGHIAGIRHYRGNEFMSTQKYETVKEGLHFFKDDPLLFEPETQYQYSSFGWNLISAVIENVAEQPFLDFMETEVFQPLGMNNTVPDWADEDIPNRTRFYIWRSGKNVEAPYVDNSYKWAGGGFIGTTEDLIRFGKAHLDYDYLDEETQEQLMFPQELSNGQSTNYGMGWRFWLNNGRYWIGHSGGSVGGSTMFLMNKQHRMIIAYTINRSNVNFESLHFKLADIFLDK